MNTFRVLVSQLIFLFNPVWGLRLAGATIGKNVFIGRPCHFEMNNAEYLIIEDDVVIAKHTKFVMHDSSLNNVTGYDVVFGKII